MGPQAEWIPLLDWTDWQEKEGAKGWAHRAELAEDIRDEELGRRTEELEELGLDEELGQPELTLITMM